LLFDCPGTGALRNGAQHLADNFVSGRFVIMRIAGSEDFSILSTAYARHAAATTKGEDMPVRHSEEPIRVGAGESNELVSYIATPNRKIEPVRL
jgi:hypothetical protein